MYNQVQRMQKIEINVCLGVYFMMLSADVNKILTFFNLTVRKGH